MLTLALFESLVQELLRGLGHVQAAGALADDAVLDTNSKGQECLRVDKARFVVYFEGGLSLGSVEKNRR